MKNDEIDNEGWQNLTDFFCLLLKIDQRQKKSDQSDKKLKSANNGDGIDV